MGHYGSDALFKSLLYSGHKWQSMRADCINYVAACIPCQRFNIGKHGFHPMSTSIAKFPLDHISFDLKSFPVSKYGHTTLLVVVDICTRFVFLRPLRDKSMHTVSQVLYTLFCDTGFPKIITSDNGKEFVNSLLDEIVQLARIDRRLITACHPQGNAPSERAVQTISQNR
jgi:transposase InsO family protein